MQHSLWVTHQPTLNSTWASNSATTGAVAALHPLTLDRIRPSCFEWRTILINPGCWLLVWDTKSSSFSFSSSTKHAQTFYINIWRDLVRDRWVKGGMLASKLPPTTCRHVLLQWQYFVGRRPTVLMLHCFDHWTKVAAAWASTADPHGAFQP